MLYLEPGLYVIEGPDDTGKSSFWFNMAGWSWGRKPLFIHSPSGIGSYTKGIYRMLEQQRKIHPWTRQLAHLSCHMEIYDKLIIPSLEQEHAVVMDRCWWSTIAYGRAQDPDFNEELIQTLINTTTQGVSPKCVMLFMSPWKENEWNVPRLFDEYWELRKKYLDSTILMPQTDPFELAAWGQATLHERGFLREI